jgi:hypothetical protein
MKAWWRWIRWMKGTLERPLFGSEEVGERTVFGYGTAKRGQVPAGEEIVSAVARIRVGSGRFRNDGQGGSPRLTLF